MADPQNVHDLPPAKGLRLDLPAGQGGLVGLARSGQAPALRNGLHHHHVELEANLVLAGRGACIVGEQRHLLDPGMLVWLPGGCHHCHIQRTPDWRMHIGLWTPEILAGLPRAHPLRTPGLVPTPRRLGAAAARQARTLMELVAAHRVPALARSGLPYLLRWLWDAWEAAADVTTATTLDPAVARAAHLLAADPSRPTADLARAVGLTADHLARSFRRELGLALPEHRNRLRLDRVLEAWAPGRSLLALALAAGFGSYAQFHRVFTRQLGSSPRAWVREA